MQVTFIGFDTPIYAVIYWQKPNESEPSTKSVCFDEEEVQAHLQSALNPSHYRHGQQPNIYYAEKEGAIAWREKNAL